MKRNISFSTFEKLEIKEATDAETPSMAKLNKPNVSAKDKNTLGKVAAMLAKEKPKKESYGDSITSPKMRALAKANAKPKKPVTLPKAPWEKGTNVTYDKNGRVVKEAAKALGKDAHIAGGNVMVEDLVNTCWNKTGNLLDGLGLSDSIDVNSINFDAFVSSMNIPKY
jgi:hypothetical protein